MMTHPAPLGGWKSRLFLGFAAGALAVPTFHQGLLALLYALGITSRAPFPWEATWPLGVPQVLSTTFWGGLWGIALVFTDRRLPRGTRSVFAATLFGALAPTMVSWFVVAPMKGQAVAAGWSAPAMITGVLVNAAWGAGTAVFLIAARRLRAARPPAVAPAGTQG